jgi:hypothetical protein
VRIIGIFLLGIVLLPVAYGQYVYRKQPMNEADQAVCVTNMRMVCKPTTEPYQAMVMVRGQLLVLPPSNQQ